jgi:hypothetical protein
MQGGAPAFLQAGQAVQGQGSPASGDMVAQLEKKVNDLEQTAGEIHMLLQQIDASAGALLVPIAQAGKALKQQVQEIKARQAGPSGSTPGMESTPTPAEKPPVRPVV